MSHVMAADQEMTFRWGIWSNRWREREGSTKMRSWESQRRRREDRTEAYKSTREGFYESNLELIGDARGSGTQSRRPPSPTPAEVVLLHG